MLPLRSGKSSLRRKATSSCHLAIAFHPGLEVLEDRCLLSAGALDPTFGTGGLVVSPVSATSPNSSWDLVVLPNGKLLAAGVANNDFALVRFNADGSRDSTFGSNGVITTDFGKRNDRIDAVIVQADGKILAAGTSVIQKGNGYDSQLALARYLPDGALDRTFGNRGKVQTDLGNGTNDGIQGLAIQSDGKIVVTGVTNSFPGGDNILLARYTPSGALDTTFGNGGVVHTQFLGVDLAKDLVIQGDGKLLVAGYTQAPVGARSIALARYDVNGVLDSTFGSGGKVTTLVGAGSRAADLELLPDGRILVAGDFAWSGFGLVRYLQDGSIDTTFGNGGAAITGPLVRASAMATQANGKILVAGTYLWSDVEQDFALTRFNSDGSVDSTFGNGGWVQTDFTSIIGGAPSIDVGNAMSLQADGKIVVAGFTNVRGTVEFALARYEGDAPLLAASIASGQADYGARLTVGAVLPMLEEAARRWQAAGFDVSALGTIDVRIADLGGTTLGLASRNNIWLDDNAAGWGWFVDPTPWDDSEFSTPGDQGEQGRMDLLSVLMHELGHLLGYEHAEDGVMQETLAAGERTTYRDAAFLDASWFLGEPDLLKIRGRRV